MYKVDYLPLAARDLKEIVTYITETLRSPQAAERLVSKIVSAGESLSIMPYRHPAYMPIRPLRHEFRSLRVDNYLMFYWANEADQVVTIARVIYRKSDVLSKLDTL